MHGPTWSVGSETYGNAQHRARIAASAPVVGGDYIEFALTAPVTAPGVYDVALTAPGSRAISLGSRESSTPSGLVLETLTG